MNLLGEIRVPLLEDSRSAVRLPACVAFAVLCAAAALAVGRLLEPLVVRPYFFPAAVAFIVAALGGGAWVGVLTSAAFAAGHAFVHLPPHGSFAIADPRELLAILGFFVAGSVVSALAGALRTSYVRLREQHRLLSVVQAQREDLVSALAHDIRSPLGIVVSNAAMIARLAGEESPESVRRRALLIESSANMIASMLSDLVEAATLESGHVRLERTPVDLATLAAEAKDLLADTPGSERLRVRVPAGLPRVDVDRQRFGRVLVNLLSNGLKYSPPDSPVTLGAALDGETIVISVRDEGSGIPDGDVPRIFDKYYRSRENRSQTGLGLGLFIARLLVEAHEGKIWVESRRGAGTTFKIALRAARSIASG